MGSGKDRHIPREKGHYRLLNTKVWKQLPAQEVLKLLITGSWDWSMSGEGSPNLCQCFSKHLLLAVVRNGILDQTDYLVWLTLAPFISNAKNLGLLMLQWNSHCPVVSWKGEHYLLGTAGCRSAVQSAEMHGENLNNATEFSQYVLFMTFISTKLQEWKPPPNKLGRI